MRIPKLRKHSQRDFCFVEWKGERHRLPGRAWSAECQAAYEEFLRKHVLPPPDPVPGGTVADLILAWLQHLRKTSQRGRRNSEFGCCRDAAAVVAELYRNEPAAEFGPRSLKAVQAAMVDRGWSRPYINHQVQRIRRMFRWGVSEEMVPVTVWEALRTVEPLRSGKTQAPDTEKRQPVDWSAVWPVLWVSPPTVRSMVLLQWYTGARSQNVTGLRPCEIDQSGSVWTWTPGTHKSAWRGRGLVLHVGPHAQQAIEPFLDRDPQAWCFSPREAHSWRSERRANARKTPIYNGHRRRRTAKQLRDRYDTITYRQAVQYACRAAGVDPWTPYQLRHARATLVRQSYDLEAAQAYLGHENIDTTQIYAQSQSELARRVAFEIG